MTSANGRSVMVTGAAGSLGGKLVEYLEQADWCGRILATDLSLDRLHDLYKAHSKVVPVETDLRQANRGLFDGLPRVDAIVHFATLNRLPDSTWQEAAYSLEMTARLLLAARDAGVGRFVFASSNHALGRYKEPPLVETIRPGLLATTLFAPGTRWQTGDGEIVGYAYGAGKIFSERMCLAAAQHGGLSTVSIRVGWCQEGANHPSTLDASGNPNLAGSGKAKGDDLELAWFRNMWLSNGDFGRIFERAILADAAAWPEPGVVVNGVSNNAGMGWEIESARDTIGYVPKDNVWDHV